MDVTDYTANSLLIAAIADRAIKAPHLKISYMPSADRYHVEWRKSADGWRIRRADNIRAGLQ